MIDNQIQPQYGSLDGSLGQSERSSGRQVLPENRPSAIPVPANANAPVPQNPSLGFTTYVIAADTLLAAQESRPARETRTDDAAQANSAYARQAKAERERSRNADDQSALLREDVVSSDPGAEIIPLYGQDPQRLQSQAAYAQVDEAELVYEANQEAARQVTDQANRAYLAAGAADGRAFGQATADSTQLYGDGLNIII